MIKTGQQAFKNLSYMLFSSFITKIASLITVIYTANIFGPEIFGKINFATSFLTYFSVIADFGISILSTRDISQNKNKYQEIIDKTLSFKFIFSLIAFFLLFLITLILNKDITTKKLILLFGLTLFSSATFSFGWVFQGIEQMKYLGYSLIIQSISSIILIFIFVKSISNVFYIPIILLISQFSAVIIQFSYILKIFNDYKFHFDLSEFRENLKRTSPVVISHMMLIISQSTPIIIIGLKLSDSAVGFFSSSQKIGFLLWEIICNYLAVIFPIIARYYREDISKMSKIVNYSIKFLFIILMPICVFIAVFSYSIVEFIYGSKFIESYWTLKILIFLPVFMFLDSLFTNILISAHRQSVSSKIKTIVTFLMIISVYSLSKSFGINAIAIIISFFTALGFILQYYKCRDLIKVDFLNSVLKPIFYSVISGAIVFYIKNYNLFLSFIISFIWYSLMIYYFKTFSKDEIEFIQENIKLVKNKFLEIVSVD